MSEVNASSKTFPMECEAIIFFVNVDLLKHFEIMAASPEFESLFLPW